MIYKKIKIEITAQDLKEVPSDKLLKHGEEVLRELESRNFKSLAFPEWMCKRRG